ncbi:hypothetical protein Gogos_021243 [Gossypium gossypioides]|uniref:Uncharacterized protein n=1 Tax=Gossypium gossypioides TaxID=34282 RepID=A0A7J9CYT0_GOSGO|nr:hypothetical protein [Gossypium gossypioides]
MKVDKRLFRALAQFWNPAYSCFTFWVTGRIKQMGDSKCIPWKILKDLILAHPNARKKVDIFALSIYGLVVFPKILGHVDEAATDLFDRLEKRVTPSRIYKRWISSGELRGCFRMRSYIGVGILTGFLCLEFGELLVMPHCLC